jgi:hypothetical protein
MPIEVDRNDSFRARADKGFDRSWIYRVMVRVNVSESGSCPYIDDRGDRWNTCVGDGYDLIVGAHTSGSQRDSKSIGTGTNRNTCRKPEVAGELLLKGGGLSPK